MKDFVTTWPGLQMILKEVLQQNQAEIVMGDFNATFS